MTLPNELLFREIDVPDLIPDVIPKERKPSGPMEEPKYEPLEAFSPVVLQLN